MRTSGWSRIVAVVVLLSACVSADRGSPADQSAPAEYGYQIVNAYPHDSRAYTQGLLYRDGVLFESTGLNGRSTLRRVRLETGEVLQQHQLEARYFGEGLAEWNGQLIQLTWQTNVGFVYDLKTFKPLRQFSYTGEGWGLTHDGKRLIMSDGGPSGQLRYLDPASLKELGRITIRHQGRPVANLNELEFVRGEIFANIYQTDRVARIDPASGLVVGWIDLSGLLSAAERRDTDVLNGIAYDSTKDRLFVTGKLWPKLFEVRLERRMK